MCKSVKVLAKIKGKNEMSAQKRKRISGLIIILLFTLSFPVYALRIQWEASDVAYLAGYRVYAGCESGQYCDTLDVGNVIEYNLKAFGMECGKTYYFSVTAYDDWGNESGFSPEISYTAEESGTSTDVNEGVSGYGPREFNLVQNYPNPFNPTTTISFTLEEHGPVNLSVYNMRGEKVKTLIDNNTMYAGITHTAIWDGSNDFGHEVASGVYLYRLQQGRKTSTRRMILAR